MKTETTKVRRVFETVHQANLEEARRLGLTLEEWHERMRQIGQGSNSQAEISTTSRQETTVTNSADYVLSYLFPRVVKKKK